jgi:hypothetical protein
MKLARLAVALLTVAVVAGCAPTVMRWTNNNNTTYDQWMKDRYTCLQETQQRFSDARVNQYGGAATSVVVPLCSAFRACLAARGYYRSDDTGTLTVPKGATGQCMEAD